MNFDIGDIVRMKKPHPCGGFEWIVRRAGADFRIECAKCGHSVMLSRVKFEKGFKKLVSKAESAEDADLL